MTIKSPDEAGRITRSRIKGIAFDCFGTLVHVTEPRGVHRTIARLVGGRLEPSPMTTGMTIVECVAAAAPRTSRAELDALAADVATEVASIRPMPGAMEAYSAFSGFDVMLASNLSCEYAGPTWDMFDAEFVCFSFLAEAAKPSASFFRHLLMHYAWDAGQLLMVGDSYASDHLGASALGMNTVLVSSSPRRDVETIPDIGSLPAWFGRRWG